ncbi:MAG TPA: hypothetical protein V6D17_25270 [Candidatus Obscuribacterales bacterium]
MTQTAEQLDVGAFLVQLGLIGERDLHEIRSLAATTGLPIRNAVMLSGQVSQSLLDAAFRLYSITRTAKLPPDVIRDAFTLVRDQNLTVENALAQAGMKGQIIGYSRLGTLLVESGLITKDQLDEARKTSYETGLPLGRMLQLLGVVDQPTIELALDLQKQLRQQIVTKDEALRRLGKEEQSPAAPQEAAFAQDATLGQPISAHQSRRVRTIDLLLLSSAVTEMDVLDAVEAALHDARPISQILLENQAVDSDVLKLAVELHEAVESGSLHILEATDTLHYVATTGSTRHAMGEQSARLGAVDFVNLLIKAQIITEYDLTHAVNALRHYPSLIGKLLITSGAIDESVLLAALRCHQLLSRNYLSEETAVTALQHAILHRHTMDDALQELGIETSALHAY